MDAGGFLPQSIIQKKIALSRHAARHQNICSQIPPTTFAVNTNSRFNDLVEQRFAAAFMNGFRNIVFKTWIVLNCSLKLILISSTTRFWSVRKMKQFSSFFGGGGKKPFRKIVVFHFHIRWARIKAFFLVLLSLKSPETWFSCIAWRLKTSCLTLFPKYCCKFLMKV